MTEPVTELQTTIMKHLALSADAAETVAGVNAIWLQRSNTVANLIEVEKALDDLVERHLMEKHIVPGGAMVYRRRQDVRANLGGVR
jgi:hypothetical protein